MNWIECIYWNIDDLLLLTSNFEGFWAMYNHRCFNKYDILLFLAWLTFLKDSFMEWGRVGNNRVSYLLNYHSKTTYFHILGCFLWDTKNETSSIDDLHCYVDFRPYDYAIFTHTTDAIYIHSVRIQFVEHMIRYCNNIFVLFRFSNIELWLKGC